MDDDKTKTKRFPLEKKKRKQLVTYKTTCIFISKVEHKFKYIMGAMKQQVFRVN